MVEEEKNPTKRCLFFMLYILMYPFSLALRALSIIMLVSYQSLAIIAPVVVALMIWHFQDEILGVIIEYMNWISVLSSLGFVSFIFSKINDKAWDCFDVIIKNIKEVDYAWFPCFDLPKAWEETNVNFKHIPEIIVKGWELSLLLGLGMILALVTLVPKLKSEDRYHIVVVGMDEPKIPEIKKYLVQGDTTFSLVHVKNANASGDGICLAEYEKLWLTKFRNAINECKSNNEERDMPYLEITGFTSSAPASPHNEVVNCEFANLRAMAVAGFLTGNEKWKWKCDDVRKSHSRSESLCDPDEIEKTCEGNGLRVKLKQWNSHAAMVAHKPVDDGTSSDGKTSALEFFNRSVHIRVPNDFCRVVEHTEEQVALRDKLGADLLSLVEGHTADGVDRATSYVRSKGLDVREGRVPVQVVAASRQHVPDLEQRINSAGGSVQSRFENSIFAAIPLQALGEIAADDAVWRIDAERRAFAPQTRNAAKPQPGWEEDQ